jgi:hypothetical protein
MRNGFTMATTVLALKIDLRPLFAGTYFNPHGRAKDVSRSTMKLVKRLITETRMELR